MNASSKRARSFPPSFSAQLLFDLTVLILLLLVVWSASRPEFRGGILVAAVAGIVAVLQLVAVVREHFWRPDTPGAEEKPAEPYTHLPSADDVDVEGLPANLGLRESWLAVSYLALLFLLVYFLGTMAGCTAFVALFFATQPGFRWQITVPMVLVIGIGAPYLLSATLGLHLWEGVIPELIPGWVGGATPPPL